MKHLFFFFALTSLATWMENEHFQRSFNTINGNSYRPKRTFDGKNSPKDYPTNSYRSTKGKVTDPKIDQTNCLKRSTRTKKKDFTSLSTSSSSSSSSSLEFTSPRHKKRLKSLDKILEILLTEYKNILGQTLTSIALICAIIVDQIRHTPKDNFTAEFRYRVAGVIAICVCSLYTIFHLISWFDFIRDSIRGK